MEDTKNQSRRKAARFVQVPESVLGRIIYLYREERKMTMKKLSSIMGLSINDVWRLENGKVANPTIATLEKIAKGLELTLSGLIDKMMKDGYGSEYANRKKNKKKRTDCEA